MLRDFTWTPFNTGFFVYVAILKFDAEGKDRKAASQRCGFFLSKSSRGEEWKVANGNPKPHAVTYHWKLFY